MNNKFFAFANEQSEDTLKRREAPVASKCTTTMRLHTVFYIIIFITTSTLLFHFFTFIDSGVLRKPYLAAPQIKYFIDAPQNHEEYNIWLIFTKVVPQSPLLFSFDRLIQNILALSSVPIDFHIITDNSSMEFAIGIFKTIAGNLNKTISYKFYDVVEFANKTQDIVQVLTPHFSSRPGTYYSDALFYLSLGLYRLVPRKQELAVMIDCDVLFKQDVLKLFEQFKFFKANHLYGLAPELSPVYKHVLHMYKKNHNITFGEYIHDEPIRNMTSASSAHARGFPGYNSGVVLFNFTAIRMSKTYQEVLKEDYVASLTKKYNFRGNLGDQDFYTLIGYEHPELIKTLSCGFNRQLCTWWRNRGGYMSVFDDYFKCNDEIVILHGNCHTNIPQ